MKTLGGLRSAEGFSFLVPDPSQECDASSVETPRKDPIETPLVEWDAAWDLGIPLIDAQHRKLVGMIRTLQEAFRRPDRDAQTLLVILFQMLDYAITHFSDEEHVFLGHGWPGEASHLSEHEAFLQRARALLGTFGTDSETLQQETLTWLLQWLQHHILRSDRAFADYLAAVASRT